MFRPRSGWNELFPPEGQHHGMMPESAGTGWCSFTGLSLPILSASSSCDPTPCAQKHPSARLPRSCDLTGSSPVVALVKVLVGYLLSLAPSLSRSFLLCVDADTDVQQSALSAWAFSYSGDLHPAAVVTAWLHWLGIRLLYGLLSWVGIWRATALQWAI